MIEDKITAFPDGNSLVYFCEDGERLVIGNSEGIVKIFDTEEPDLEPQAIDILENLTALAHHDNSLIISYTSGDLELIDMESNLNKGSIYRSELPLRACAYINGGKRIVCGGDTNKMAIIDMENNRKVTTVSLPEQLLGISYNYTGELLAVSLANSIVQVYSVVNEEPNLIHTFSDILQAKIHMSMDKIDYENEHGEELICTTPQWSSNGKFCLLPTNTDSIVVYDRDNWNEVARKFEGEGKIVDFKLSPDMSHLAILYKDASLVVVDFQTTKVLDKKQFDLEGSLPLNIAWGQNSVTIGSSNGEALNLKDIVKAKKALSLFLDEAEESSDDEEPVTNRRAFHEEDSMLIDEDEEDDDFDAPKRRFDDEDVKVDYKRSKPNGYVHIAEETLKPYSPGSTPWSSEINKDANASADRRYLFMNSIAYAWSVRDINNDRGQQSITVSFFDRSIHKDYHITDFFAFDLCSINATGILLACSGHKDTGNIAKIYYRNHDSELDSWEKKIPLLKNEFITSVSLTHQADNTEVQEDAHIVVGTNFGYLRIFNSYGVSLNVMKTLPIVTLISSNNSVVFLVHELGPGMYTYSILDINQDYRFLQQDIHLPIKATADAPLIKGLFFNEYNDPCLVPGYDDTLMILHSWRETNNSKWIPILNCAGTITEHGSNPNKANWNCWPLGMYRDSMNCLILKNNNSYPGFPLPLPIELEIQLPIRVHSGKSSEDEEEPKEDPEEEFLRSLTMGKLVSNSLNDESIDESNDVIMERLTNYSILFDKSLLKMFAESCKETRLNRALSIARLIKTDKALAAASKISERMQFTNLATKISKLREELVESDGEDEEED